MNRLFAIALALAGCAHAPPDPGISGTEFATGLYSFAPRTRGLAPAPTPAAARGPLRASAWIWIRAYQATLSRIDGATCRFRPTCSGFAVEAVSRYGLYGVLLAMGRLHRFHSDQRHYHMTEPPFLDDPLSNYTFWLRPPRWDDFASYDDEAQAWYQHVRATTREERGQPARPER